MNLNEEAEDIIDTSPGMFCLEKQSDGHYSLGNDYFTVKKGSILRLQGCIDGEDAGWIDVQLNNDISCAFKGLVNPLTTPYPRFPQVTPINLEYSIQSAFQDYLEAKKVRIAMDMENCIRRREVLESELQTLQAKIQSFQLT